MILRRSHEDTMRDYITLLSRDLSEFMDMKIKLRMEETSCSYRDARRSVRTTNPVRKRKMRLSKAEDHLARYLRGVAYWKEKETPSIQQEQST